MHTRIPPPPPLPGVVGEDVSATFEAPLEWNKMGPSRQGGEKGPEAAREEIESSAEEARETWNSTENGNGKEADCYQNAEAKETRILRGKALRLQAPREGSPGDRTRGTVRSPGCDGWDQGRPEDDLQAGPTRATHTNSPKA